jgi:putative transposase
MKKTRTRHSPAFKAKVALAALREQESVAELARRYKIHANVVYKWKRQLLDNAAQSFETAHSDGVATEREDVLLKKIGELTVERDFCPTGSGDPDDAATSPDYAARRAVNATAVRAAGRDPIERVLRAGGAGRGGTGVDAPGRRVASEVSLLRQPDDHADAEGRGHRDQPEACPATDAGDGPGEHGPTPSTSVPAPDHAVYPYLLRGVTIARTNHVWATDITYVPMARGFAYLVAIIDWDMAEYGVRRTQCGPVAQ